MNRNVILTSEDAIKENSVLNDNCFGKYILPSIIYAQENQLQSVLGTCLYEKIIDMVADGTISLEVSVAYKDLLDNYIQPFLINQTLSEVIVNAGAKVANLGAVISNDEHVSNLSQKEMELLRNSYVEKADFYMKRMQNFLKDNRAAFPELDCNCGNVKPNLDSNTNSIGLWTGGIRGKRSKSSGCGCSSNQSEPHSGQYEDGYRDGFVAGRTSGITEGEAIQRGRMISTAVTENGVYERYDGFKEISVNVNTGHSDQEIIDAFNSGYSSGETVGFENGYASGETVGFESGFTSGETEQKNKLVSTAVTVNGVYAKEDGFSSVEVAVPQTGHTDEEMQQMYQSGITYQKSLLTSLNVSQNGQYQREDGYYFVEVNVPQSGHTDAELEEAYNNGYTSGVSFQKSQLVSTAVTANTVLTRENGFSSVTINVPQTGISGTELLLTASTLDVPNFDTYYFTYDANTPYDTITINFYTNRKYFTVSTIISSDGTQIELYNANVDTSEIDRIKINGTVVSKEDRVVTLNHGFNTIYYYFTGNTVPENFMKDIQIGDGYSVTVIGVSLALGDGSFSGSNVNSINNLHGVGDYALADSNVSEITFSNFNNITVGAYAFSGCSNLAKISFDTQFVNHLPTIDATAFTDVADNGVIEGRNNEIRTAISQTAWFSYLQNKGWTIADF